MVVYWLIDTVNDHVVGSTDDEGVATEMVKLIEVTLHHGCRVLPVTMTDPKPPVVPRHRRPAA